VGGVVLDPAVVLVLVLGQERPVARGPGELGDGAAERLTDRPRAQLGAARRREEPAGQAERGVAVAVGQRHQPAVRVLGDDRVLAGGGPGHAVLHHPHHPAIEGGRGAGHRTEHVAKHAGHRTTNAAARHRSSCYSRIMIALGRAAAVAATLTLAVGVAEADSFGGIAANEKSYLVGASRVCTPVVVTAGAASGSPACHAAPADEVARLSTACRRPSAARRRSPPPKGRALTVAGADGARSRPGPAPTRSRASSTSGSRRPGG
jgi:hypothetical protein